MINDMLVVDAAVPATNASKENVAEPIRPMADTFLEAAYHDMEQEGSTVRVRLLLTDPMCLYLFEMRSQIIEVLSGLSGVEAVEVEPVAGKLWSAERMAPEARRRLESLRRKRLEKLGLTPPSRLGRLTRSIRHPPTAPPTRAGRG